MHSHKELLFTNTLQAVKLCKERLVDSLVHSAKEVESARELVAECRDIAAFFDGLDLDTVIYQTCELCNQAVDEDGRCGCTNEDANF
ncbi:MAG TPA: hypothetical protein PKW49_05150 [Paludibacteraceae bacterium]|nr:hypothetical protein [Paludibacteraceae bacterium]